MGMKPRKNAPRSKPGTVRMWFTEYSRWSVEMWEARPKGVPGGWWAAGGSVLLCKEKLGDLGVKVPADRPILIELSARVVEGGDGE